MWSGLALGLLGAALFSCKAIIVKLAYRHGADPVSLIALRMIFAAPFFAAAAAYAHWQAKQSNESPWRPGDRLKIFLLGGLGYYASSFLDFLGLQYISAGLERLILYLTPSIVVLIAVFYHKQKISGVEWLSLLVTYSGIVFVLLHNVSLEGKQVLLGSALVFASAICYSIYLSGVGELVKRLGALRLTAWASLISTGFCVMQALILTPKALFTQSAEVYQLSVLNGFFCTVVPVFLIMAAISRIGSSSASQTGMFGPVVTIFLAAAFLDEAITTIQLIGTAIVLFGIFICHLRK